MRVGRAMKEVSPMEDAKSYLLAELTVLPGFLDEVKATFKEALIPDTPRTKLAHAANRCTFDCRYEPRFGNDGERAEVSIRSLLSLECFSSSRSALAGTPGGYSALGAALHAAVFPAHEQGR